MSLEIAMPPRTAADASAEELRSRTVRILEENAPTVARIAASYARGRAERDDLLQDIALALWRALPSFRGECSERTFLLRVAHNRALTLVAKRRGAAEDIDDHEDRVVATSGKNPAIAYERRESASRLMSAVRALPVSQRQVITLVLEGLSHREIAEVIGATENVVAVRASRARDALRVLMEGEGSSGERKAER